MGKGLQGMAFEVHDDQRNVQSELIAKNHGGLNLIERSVKTEFIRQAQVRWNNCKCYVLKIHCRKMLCQARLEQGGHRGQIFLGGPAKILGARSDATGLLTTLEKTALYEIQI